MGKERIVFMTGRQPGQAQHLNLFAKDSELVCQNRFFLMVWKEYSIRFNQYQVFFLRNNKKTKRADKAGWHRGNAAELPDRYVFSKKVQNA